MYTRYEKYMSYEQSYETSYPEIPTKERWLDWGLQMQHRLIDTVHIMSVSQQIRMFKRSQLQNKWNDRREKSSLWKKNDTTQHFVVLSDLSPSSADTQWVSRKLEKSTILETYFLSIIYVIFMCLWVCECLPTKDWGQKVLQSVVLYRFFFSKWAFFSSIISFIFLTCSQLIFFQFQ